MNVGYSLHYMRRLIVQPNGNRAHRTNQVDPWADTPAVFAATTKNGRVETGRNGNGIQELPIHELARVISDATASVESKVAPEILARMSPSQKDLLHDVRVRGQVVEDEWLRDLDETNPEAATAYRNAAEEAEREREMEALEMNQGDPGNEIASNAGTRESSSLLEPGTKVKALDRDNIGTVIQDHGPRVTVEFVSPNGSTARKDFPKDRLAFPNGKRIVPKASSGKPVNLGIMGSTEFMQATYKSEWLINGFLVAGDPCIMGGASKSLKTTIAVLMHICLAIGSIFLGEFRVPRRVKTLLMSGESGKRVIQESARRMCKSEGIAPEDLDGYAYWGFDLPKLDDEDHLNALSRYIHENEIEVVVLDPLYLCLISAANGHVDPSNLFDMGPLLKSITSVCLESGATPVLIHHFRKNRENPLGPPEMEDFAFAGIQEFARQWILVARREKYEPGTGEHKLWLSVGGSNGHSGEWALDVQEGVVGENFADRTWQTSLQAGHVARSDQRQAKDSMRALKKSQQLEADATACWEVLREQSEAISKEEWKRKVAEKGVPKGRFEVAFDALLDRQQIEKKSIELRTGNGARTSDGWLAVLEEFEPA